MDEILMLRLLNQTQPGKQLPVDRVIIDRLLGV